MPLKSINQYLSMYLFSNYEFPFLFFLSLDLILFLCFSFTLFCVLFWHSFSVFYFYTLSVSLFRSFSFSLSFLSPLSLSRFPFFFYFPFYFSPLFLCLSPFSLLLIFLFCLSFSHLNGRDFLGVERKNNKMDLSMRKRSHLFDVPIFPNLFCRCYGISCLEKETQITVEALIFIQVESFAPLIKCIPSLSKSK